MPRDWNAASYDRLPIPMTRWGAAVVEWLDLRGDERVLDAGCGTGQVTALLLDRLPHGRVVALDGSRSMLEQARARLGDEHVEYVEADLEGPIPIEGTVDAVLSTATFHWIRDHEALFRHLAAVIRPGGQLATQCGGEGNIASIQAILAELEILQAGWKNFAEPETTSRRLEAAGFTDIEVWLQPESAPLPAGDLEPYLETICLSGIVEGMPEPEARRLVREVAGRMPEPAIDYVRLNIRARKALASEAR
jgi:trans-aconitate 2-methyltransferase